MEKELPKAYEPSLYEDGIYKKWEESGFFNPDNLKVPKSAKPFSIAMPPPNVTGVLHLGHALENTIMDIEARFQRMRGEKVLLIPGTDHAAVATQARVEKEMIKQGIKDPRKELGREELLKRIRQYAENSKATIIKQIKKMGTSCDWSRLAYTFDEPRSKAVNEIFTRMYNDDLIYRGYRVVNWSVKGQSTCSDDELVYVEEKTKLYTFRYAKDFPIAISTTRPETKLGDTAVAVYPGDKRYKRYVGKTYTVDVGARRPLKIKIIADKNIEVDFGTGAVGVTPAHSQIDYELYEKHNLELRPVIGSDGRMTSEAGKDYQGLTVEEARKKFLIWLKKNSLLEKEENITHNVSTSDRFSDVVEVIPMEQWFVNVNKKIPNKSKTLKDLMREAITTGHKGNKDKKIMIIPKRFNNQYFHWIDNLRDWCISRQIWWGHRIPVWYKSTINNSHLTVNNDKDKIYVGVEPPKGKNWQQDEDTLDTWFSSGLWTFSTLGWPRKTADLKIYHPTAWMQMGYEILFFWMARMILMSTYAVDDIPFKDVYIHGMLRDQKGRKFSKSLGTGIDPIKMCETYGTDALRLSLILGITPGNDSRFYDEKMEGARNFVNKLWNVARYILQTTDNRQQTRPNASVESGAATDIEYNKLTDADKWILWKMHLLIRKINEDLKNYRFSQAGESLREFTWGDLADWYLEVTKFVKSSEKDKVLNRILEDLLKLWHPFIPFVTEKIWELMGNQKMLLVENFPNEDFYKKVRYKAERLRGIGLTRFEIVINIIKAIRNARAENKVEPGKKIKAVVYAGKHKDLILSQAEIIKGLRTGIEELEVKDKGKKYNKEVYITVGEEIEIYLIGMIDKDKEKKRIKKEIERLKELIKTTESKLSKDDFITKAPKIIIKKEKVRLKDFKAELKNLEKQIKSLN